MKAQEEMVAENMMASFQGLLVVASTAVGERARASQLYPMPFRYWVPREVGCALSDPGGRGIFRGRLNWLE